LTESVAIVLYLGEKYPAKGLVPANLARRAEVNHWLLFAATELEQPLWRIARHTNIYPKERRLPGTVPLARDDFKDMASVLDGHMEGKRFVLGDTMRWPIRARPHTRLGKRNSPARRFPLLQAYYRANVCPAHAPPRIRAALAGIARRNG